MARLSTLFELLLREEWRNVNVAECSQPGEWLVPVAAALNVGEPKRARRILAAAPDTTGVAAEVAAALRELTEVLDRNWFPGGGAGVLTDEDIALLTAGSSRRRLGSRPALLVTVVRDVMCALPTWRWLVTTDGLARQYALQQAETVLGCVRDATTPGALAPVALAVVDLEPPQPDHIY
jgi:hypothetical protein